MARIFCEICDRYLDYDGHSQDKHDAKEIKDLRECNKLLSGMLKRSDEAYLKLQEERNRWMSRVYSAERRKKREMIRTGLKWRIR